MKGKDELLKMRPAAACALVAALALVLLAGCGKEPEAPMQNVTTKISVTKDELCPELSDEDLGISRRDPDDLFAISGYRSWEGYCFLVLKKGGPSEQEVTVEIPNKEYFRSLYSARNKVLLDVSYSSVSPEDPMYAAYALGLRSLGSDFYSCAPQSDTEAAMTERQAGTEPQEEAPDGAPKEGEPSEGESTEEGADEGSGGPSVEEPTEEAAEGASEDVVEAPEEESGGVWEDDMEEVEVAAEKNLQKAIEGYMKTVSLNRATKVTVFALDGEMLGEITADKLDDYSRAVDFEPVEYSSSTEGVVYTSDLEDGVQYKVAGFKADPLSESYTYTIKNDARKPILIRKLSATDYGTEAVFENYMETDMSLGWALNEDQHTFSSSDSEYVIQVDFKNSDADLVGELDPSKVLTIDGVYEEPVMVPSNYSAIVNATGEPVNVMADTKDGTVLGSKQALGLHRSAYSTITVWFDGAKGLSEEMETGEWKKK